MSALKGQNGHKGIDTVQLELPKQGESDADKTAREARNTVKVKDYFADSEFSDGTTPISVYSGKGPEADPLGEAFEAAVKNAGMKTSDYVSEEINDALENKNATANAVNYYLQGTKEERTERIANYLTETGRFTEEQVAEKSKSIESNLENFLLNTGIVQTDKTDPTEMDKELRAQLEEHRGKGTVLQLAESAAGLGTAVLHPAKLEKWLDSDTPILDQLAEHDNFKHMSKEKIASEFNKGVSWQAMSDIDVEGSIIFSNEGSANGLVPTMASTQVVDDGVHKGNKMIEPNTLRGYSDDLGLISELVLDRQLKDAKNDDGTDRFPEGMKGVFAYKDGAEGADPKYAMAIAGADLFVTNDGKLQISEYNIRPTGSTKAHDSSLYHEEEPIYPRDSAIMKPNGFIIAEDLVDRITMEGDIGFQAYAELVKEKTDPIIMKGETLETETGEILRPSIDGGGTFYTDAADQTEDNFIKMFPTVFFPAIKAVDNVVEKAVTEAVTEPDKNIFQKAASAIGSFLSRFFGKADEVTETPATPEAPEAPRELAYEQAIANEIGEAMASITPREVKYKARKIRLRNERAEQRAARAEAKEAADAAAAAAAEIASGAQHSGSFTPDSSQDAA